MAGSAGYPYSALFITASTERRLALKQALTTSIYSGILAGWSRCLAVAYVCMYVWEEGGKVGVGGGSVTASHSVSQDGKNVWRQSPAAYVHVAGPASVSLGDPERTLLYLSRDTVPLRLLNVM